MYSIKNINVIAIHIFREKAPDAQNFPKCRVLRCHIVYNDILRKGIVYLFIIIILVPYLSELVKFTEQRLYTTSRHRHQTGTKY